MLLNYSVQWRTVMDLVNVSPDSNFLPCNCPCPNCSSNLTIYKDITATSAQWFYCKNCELSGDTIELLAAYMKLGLMDTINFLVSKGIIDNTKENYSRRVFEYINRQAGYRNKILSFWNMIKGCEERITKEHMDIISILNLSGSSSDTKGVKQVFGFSNRAEVLKSLVIGNSSAGADGGCNRVFKGKGWKSVCMVAAFDMPGRIKSFIIFGQLSSGNVSVIIRHICYKTWNAYETEPGLMFLNEAASSECKSAIVVTDTMQGLKIVIDYIDKYGKFPPIVVSTPDEEKRSCAWKILMEENKDVIITGPKTSEIAPFSLEAYVSEFSEGWDSSWVGSAKWVTKTIEKKAKQKIMETSPKKDDRKMVLFNNTVYECKKDGMYAGARTFSTLVMDASLNIEEILLTKGDQYYIGTITSHSSGDTASFKVRSALLDHRFYHWLKAFSLKKGIGHIMCRKSYTPYAVKVSILLNPPRIVTDLREDAGEGIAYRFSKHNIMKSGRVVELPAVKKFREGSLCLSEPLSPFEKDALGDERNELAWAVIVACMSNAMSNITNKPKIGVAVDPACFDDVRAIAEAVGSRVCSLSNKGIRKAGVAGILDMEARSNFPIVIDPSVLVVPSHREAIEMASGPRNCIITLSEASMLGARTITRWVRIKDGTHTMTESLRSACKKIGILFLTWIIKTKHRPLGTNSIKKAVEALSEWCVKSDITLDGLHKGIGLLDHDLDSADNKSKANAFKAAMGLVINSEGLSSNGDGAVDGEITWVACKDIYSVLSKHSIPIANRGSLAKALLETRTIKEYAMFKGTNNPSWAILTSDLEVWARHM